MIRIFEPGYKIICTFKYFIFDRKVNNKNGLSDNNTTELDGMVKRT